MSLVKRHLVFLLSAVLQSTLLRILLNRTPAQGNTIIQSIHPYSAVLSDSFDLDHVLFVFFTFYVLLSEIP